MEIIGDDKRIRALFSETRFADEQAAPSFAATWGRTQSRALKPHRAFNFSFAVATALLVFVLAGLALWSRRQTTLPTYSVSANLAAADLKAKVVKSGSQSGKLNDQLTNHPQIKVQRTSAQRNALMLAALNRKAEKKAEAEAKQLASWQSPTASLLNSSSDSLFKSLPQLNENSTELKSFLPNRQNEKEK